MVNTATLQTRLGTKVHTIAKPMMNIESVADDSLVTVNSNYIALTNNALEIIQENLKKQPLSFQIFDIAKSPSGGSTVFSVPGLSGDETAKELTGIILNYTTPRAYWDTPDPVEGTPPVCFSRDSITSEDEEACVHCPFNTYGSKDGDSNAKAWKESVVIFLLRPDNIMPLLVRVPVTSKLIFLRYMARLIGKMIPLSGVVTRIMLDKATSKAGKPYALFNFEAISILGPEEAAQARTFGQQFMELIDVASLEPDIDEVD